MLNFKRFFVFVLIMVFATNYVIAETEKRNNIRIAAGSILEGYYFIGLKFCKYISEANNGIHCEVVPTTGTLENITLLRKGEVDFALALSNIAIDAYKGVGYFAESGPFTDIAQLITLHDEALTVIVKDKDKILLLSDIDGRKMSNSPRNSDSTIVYEALSAYYKFKKKPEDIEMAHEDYAKNLCNGKIDAIITMSGHPSALVNFITHTCDCEFAGIESEKINKLLEKNKAFKKYVIDKNTYPKIAREEQTIAAPAIFVTTQSVPKEIVINFMAYFKDRIDQFKQSDPLLYDLDNAHFTSGLLLPEFKGGN